MHNLLKYAYEPNVRLSTYTKKHHGTEFPPYWIEGLLYLDPWFLLGYETQEKKKKPSTLEEELKTVERFTLKMHQMFKFRPHFAGWILNATSNKRFGFVSENK